MTRCDFCAVSGSTPTVSHLGSVLGGGRNPQVASNEAAVVVPTIGAFTAGYVLIVPRRHTLALSQLPDPDRHDVADLAVTTAQRLSDLYARPVLGFEYGLKAPGARRIEHAHLHLLPSSADLRWWLSAYLTAVPVPSLADVPNDPSSSYITVWGLSGETTYFPVPTNAFPRLRLRQVVAHLDRDIAAADWDWEQQPCRALMLRTLEELAPSVRVRDTAGAAGGFHG
jgi:diadenosine tetraphosphate (Ap4A) HIT family hydrolase